MLAISKKEEGYKIIDKLQNILLSYLNCRQYQLAKPLFDLIIVLDRDIKRNEGIYPSYIDDLKKINFDVDFIYDYIYQFGVEIHR